MYVNLDSCYFSHPKTQRLVGLLGPGADVLPIRLWCVVANHFRGDDGRLPDVSDGELEGLIGWTGETGKAVAALLRCRFIERDGEALLVHNWSNANGHIEGFHKRAVAAARARWSGRAVLGGDASNAPSIAKQCRTPTSSNALTQPNPLTQLTQPTNPTQPNPLARRKRSQNGKHGAEEGGAGSGSGSGGNLAGTLRAVARLTSVQPDDERTLAVQARLASLGINHETAKELLPRRDVTPERIDAEIASIRAGGPVDSEAAVLVARLRNVAVKRMVR